MLLEFFFQDLERRVRRSSMTTTPAVTYVCILASEKDSFVELADSLSNIDDFVKLIEGKRVVFVCSSAAVVVSLEVRSKARNCPQQKDDVEVNVL